MMSLGGKFFTTSLAISFGEVFFPIALSCYIERGVERKYNKIHYGHFLKNINN